ncbi:MAG TPA: TonB-dependent receptor [Vicinamibacterales bacterium]|nr:TonB-dependent receptor [Vicinamibacterales bacterium]
MFRISRSVAALWVSLVIVPAVVPMTVDAATAGQGSAVRTARVTGVVRDQNNAVTLPGVPVSIVGTDTVVFTDIDGRYTLDLVPGTYQLKIAMDGYQERLVDVVVTDDRLQTVDVPLTMTGFTEQVTVTASAVDAVTSTQEAQLSLRRNAQVITDNMGAQEMKSNGDSDAAAALQRVTGISLVDNQFVFVRGLGERYSNTTLGGSVIPTTEPDKKVVPLDLFPTALIDSVQIAKSYTPDRSADFAGGLVEIMPLKMANRQVFDFSYGGGWYANATGKSRPFSSLGSNDWWGFDGGSLGLPSGFPTTKVVRAGIFTPDVGFSRDEITAFGKSLDTTVWRPQTRKARPAQNLSAAYGNRFGNFGVLASFTQSYKETYQDETRRFFRIGDDDQLEPVTDYAFQTGTQRAQTGIVGNIAYQFNPSHRIAFENFYTHSGRDEGRTFEGLNTENNFVYRNYRLQFIEESLLSNRVSGDHFFPQWRNSRVDWRAGYGHAKRDEPDLRETLYQQTVVNGAGTGNFVLADESQSGFRLFNDLGDDSIDLAANWSTFGTLKGRPMVYKAGGFFLSRTRDFTSRRFRYIPTNQVALNLTQQPEVLFASANIGPAYRFNEETRPVDAYDAQLDNFGGYLMGDWVLSAKSRLVGGVRVENFRQEVNTFDPFGLFEQREQALLENTDVFPGVNFVYSLRPNTNLRLGFSQTANRPEFRELAAFEFTDVVGNRAVRGNPDLVRTLIQNYDARLEAFTGGRGVLAVSAFFKNFNDPIERVINAGAQPLQTFENAAKARNLGVEVEAGRQVTRNLYFSANYTFVDSEITLTENARRVQTSTTRPLAGQSRNLLNALGEFAVRGFQARVLYNFFDDRIADVGANQAPDIIEQGRGTVDVVLVQRLGRLMVRASADNLADEPFLFKQGDREQRRFDVGRSFTVSFGYSFF